MAAMTAAEQASGTHQVPKWIALALCVLVGAALLFGGWGWWSHRRYKAAKLEIENHVSGGRVAAACRDLEALLAWKSDENGELHYLFGSCELSRGNLAATEKAWASVLPGAEYSERAILGRALLLHNQGRLAKAEQLVSEAATDPRNNRSSLMIGLVPILSDLGRRDEAAELIEDRWEALNSLGQGALDPAIKLLLQYVELTTREDAIDVVRSSLDESGSRAPDDDRVWLGRANLAIRSGDLKDAERWLNECEKKRPDDRAVWRARLKLAMATDRADFVESALTQLPELASHSWEQHRIKAWIAHHRGDVAEERSELELLLVAEPGDLLAFDRLIELRQKEGQPALAAELAQKKNAMRKLRDRYMLLVGRKQPIRDAEELATIAEQLGRRFEARGFLTIASFQEPRRKDLKEKLRTFESKR